MIEISLGSCLKWTPSDIPHINLQWTADRDQHFFTTSPPIKLVVCWYSPQIQNKYLQTLHKLNYHNSDIPPSQCFFPRYAIFHNLTRYTIKNNISHCYLVALSRTHKNECLITTDCHQPSLPPVIHMCNCKWKQTDRISTLLVSYTDIKNEYFTSY